MERISVYTTLKKDRRARETGSKTRQTGLPQIYRTRENSPRDKLNLSRNTSAEKSNSQERKIQILRKSGIFDPHFLKKDL